MTPALALLAATATATASPAAAVDPSSDARVLVLPAITVDRGPTARSVREPLRALFDGKFRDAAEGTFVARRLDVVSDDERDRHTRATVGLGPCASSACAHAIARRAAATSWLVVVLFETPTGCRARATLFDVTRNRIAQRIDRDVTPCSPDRVVRAAEELGRAVADGPRRETPVALALTPLSLPSLEIEDLDDVDFTVTSTAQRSAILGFGAERALSIYRRNEFALRPNAHGDVTVLRGQTPITDCELMVAAGRRSTLDERLSCDGNWWELAYLTAPAGGIMLLATLASDEPSIAVGGLAATLLVTGPLLALIHNRDGTDPADGEHVVGAEELVELVARANATLRRELLLTEEDVLAAASSAGK